MPANQYSKKQYALEVIGVVALAPILSSIAMFCYGAQQHSRGWMGLGYLSGMVGMLMLVIYFSCSSMWHQGVQERIDEREKAATQPTVRA